MFMSKVSYHIFKGEWTYSTGVTSFPGPPPAFRRLQYKLSGTACDGKLGEGLGTGLAQEWNDSLYSTSSHAVRKCKAII